MGKHLQKPNQSINLQTKLSEKKFPLTNFTFVFSPQLETTQLFGEPHKWAQNNFSQKKLTGKPVDYRPAMHSPQPTHSPTTCT